MNSTDIEQALTGGARQYVTPDTALVQEPVTRDDIRFAIAARNRAASQLGEDLGRRLMGCRIAYWTPYAMARALEPSAWEARNWEQGYVHPAGDDGSMRVELRGPFNDRLHFYPHDGAKHFVPLPHPPAKFVVGWFYMWDTPDYTDDMVIAGKAGVIYVDTNNQPAVHVSGVGVRPLDCAEYDWENPTAVWLAHGLETFLASKYTHMDARRPPSPSEDKARTGGSGTSIAAVVCRKPESVRAQEEAAYKKMLERDGKTWALQFECPTVGHVRNQWYPSIGEHRKIVVAPFVRGKGKPQKQHETILKAQR